MANIITTLRIVFSVALLFCPALSPAFFALYVAAGISDMIDGTVARRTNTASAFGSKLDTLADFVFVAVCLVKLVPALDIPGYVCLWTAAIALIKAANIIYGFMKHRAFVAPHTAMNRVAGFLLFLLPLTLPFIDLKTTAPAVCLAATIAAVGEGRCIRAGKA